MLSAFVLCVCAQRSFTILQKKSSHDCDGICESSCSRRLDKVGFEKNERGGGGKRGSISKRKSQMVETPSAENYLSSCFPGHF